MNPQREQECQPLLRPLLASHSSTALPHKPGKSGSSKLHVVCIFIEPFQGAEEVLEVLASDCCDAISLLFITDGIVQNVTFPAEAPHLTHIPPSFPGIFEEFLRVYI